MRITETLPFRCLFGCRQPLFPRWIHLFNVLAIMNWSNDAQNSCAMVLVGSTGTGGGWLAVLCAIYVMNMPALIFHNEFMLPGVVMCQFY